LTPKNKNISAQWTSIDFNRRLYMFKDRIYLSGWLFFGFNRGHSKKSAGYDFAGYDFAAMILDSRQ